MSFLDNFAEDKYSTYWVTNCDDNENYASIASVCIKNKKDYGLLLCEYPIGIYSLHIMYPKYKEENLRNTEDHVFNLLLAASNYKDLVFEHDPVYETLSTFSKICKEGNIDNLKVIYHEY